MMQPYSRSIDIPKAGDDRFLKEQFREIDEKIIPDILPIRITSAMSVATLSALQTIFSLRYDLAYESHDTNEPTYANLQCHRLPLISKSLTTKYRSAKSLNEKIEILELIEIIELTLSFSHSDFALREADRILSSTPFAEKDGLGINGFQRLRLQWLPGIDATDCDSLVSDLIPKAHTAFHIATLSLVKDFCTDAVRSSVITRFTEIFNNALTEATAPSSHGKIRRGTSELAALLSSAATWNVDPTLRPQLKDLAERAEKAVKHNFNLNEARVINRVNAIAAEIYSRLDFLPGKYEPSPIPA